MEIVENAANGTLSRTPIVYADPDGPVDTLTVSITAGNSRADITGRLFDIDSRGYLVVRAAILDFGACSGLWKSGVIRQRLSQRLPFRPSVASAFRLVLSSSGAVRPCVCRERFE